MLKFLVSKGADLAAVTTSNMNVLHASVEANKPEVVKYVMEVCKGDAGLLQTLTNGKNSDGKLPFDIAMGAKNSAIVGILKEGGDANAASASCIIC